MNPVDRIERQRTATGVFLVGFVILCVYAAVLPLIAADMVVMWSDCWRAK